MNSIFNYGRKRMKGAFLRIILVWTLLSSIVVNTNLLADSSLQKSGFSALAVPVANAEDASDDNPSQDDIANQDDHGQNRRNDDLIRLTSLNNFVSHLYTCVLERNPEQWEIDYWVNPLKSRTLSIEDEYRGFFDSEEYKLKNTSNEKYVDQLYRCGLFREPDQAGRDMWLNRLASNMEDRVSLANKFVTSPEFIQYIKPVLDDLFDDDDNDNPNVSIAFSRVPQTSPTSPFKAGDVTTATWHFTPWDFFEGKDWIFRSKTTDTVTGQTIDDPDFLASWSDIDEQRLCDNNGNCSLTDSWQPDQFSCASNPNNLRRREDWTVANGVESNHGVFYFQCSNATGPVIQPQQADIAIVKSVDKTLLRQGDAVRYTLRVSALGPSDSTDVVVTDNLPSGISFGSASSSIGSYASSTGKWTIGSLSASSTATLIISTIVSQVTGGQTITNIASVVQGANRTDLNPQNNTASASVSVAQNNPPQPSISGGGGASGGGGSAVEFHTLLINDGASSTSSNNVKLTIFGTPVYQMKISNTTDFTDSEWEPYETSKSWVLSSGAGIKKVYAKFRYTSGYELNTVSDSIELIEEETQGQVLGVSTTTVPSSSCGVYLDSYIKLGAKNDAEEVKKLQKFLNENLGINLPITGHYGESTFKAVEQFQLKYNIAILKPWVAHGLPNETTPTGYVYKTTQWWINSLMCPQLGTPIPELP